jgi:hypothetical protein
MRNYSYRVEVDFMNFQEQFRNSTYVDQLHIAERELSAFIRAVTQLFGSEEGKRSAEDWIEESEFVNNIPRSTTRDWRAVSVAASARLARRLTVAASSKPN